jgi:hypothetical protein
VAEEIAKYMLDFVEVQEVRWNRGGTEPASKYIFLWKESITVPVHKKSDETVVIIMRYHCYQLHTKLYPIFFSQG